MKFKPDTSSKTLMPELQNLLETLRARRNFNVETYVEAKTQILNDYMKKAKLKTCVIAVSGGLDSAVVLALSHHASKQKSSPIKNIVPLLLPVFKSEYTTNQEAATKRAEDLVASFGLKAHVLNLSSAFAEIKKTVDESIGVVGENWAAGQLVAYTRTPAIYYVTSLYSQKEEPAIICGTTNRDEGAYLGYVGKASDGMVDVQIISDLHKSEVRKVAQYLKVTDAVLQATPTGDMYDGRVDEEVFGAPYDFVELFLLLRALESTLEKDSYITALSAGARKQFDELSQSLEDLHRYNGHKYLAGSPAVHLDTLESGVPGGWKTGYEKVDIEPRGKEYFVNPFTFKEDIWPAFYSTTPIIEKKQLPLEKGEGYQFSEVLMENERKELLSQANDHGWKPVGIDGIMSHYKEGDKIGSYRASSFSPELSQLIWKRISPFMPSIRIMEEDAPTDWGEDRIWRPIGISPLFRFIKYTEGGLLVPHYDGPFTYADGHKTLMSLVVYMNAENITGGQTRFIKDPQIDVPLKDKDYSDWTRFAKQEEVLIAIDPKPGAALAFDHRVLHDSFEISGDGEKVIIRTDIVFAKCGQN